MHVFVGETKKFIGGIRGIFAHGVSDPAIDGEREAAVNRQLLQLLLNAAHDNLRIFRGLPFLAEVSIGHALISRALFVGLSTAVREYLALLR